jgi:hypothetical protein
MFFLQRRTHGPERKENYDKYLISKNDEDEYESTSMTSVIVI